MKPTGVYFLLACVSLSSYPQSAANETSNASLPFTLSLSFNNDANSTDDTAVRSVKADAPVTLRMRKTNTSSHVVPKLGPENGAFGCTFDVRDTNGNPVPPHKRSSQWITGGGSAIPREGNEGQLKPGESIVDYAPVGSWFDLTHPGTYTFQISQHVSSDPNSAVVKSNKITVTIAP